jgi:guanylate kinase
MVEIGRRGLMLVLSSPSGAGKTTISRRLLAIERERMALSVSVTTRAPRPGEVEGRDYFFIDQQKFADMVAKGELLEHASVFGHRYGTPRAAVDAALAKGTDVLFDIDWQGTQQLREKARNDVVSIFVLPPDTATLEERLRQRAQDSEEVVKGRMSKASDEMSHWAEYDYIVVNRNIEACVGEVQAILTAERLRRDRQIGLGDFVRGLMRKG